MTELSRNIDIIFLPIFQYILNIFFTNFISLLLALVIVITDLLDPFPLFYEPLIP